MKSLDEIRKEHIREVLLRTDWDLRKASELLRISENFLRKEIHRLGHLKPEISLKK